ncbi:MAG: hypothetical protein AB1422_07520 [bacterium]
MKEDSKYTLYQATKRESEIFLQKGRGSNIMPEMMLIENSLKRIGYKFKGKEASLLFKKSDENGESILDSVNNFVISGLKFERHRPIKSFEKEFLSENIMLPQNTTLFEAFLLDTLLEYQYVGYLKREGQINDTLLLTKRDFYTIFFGTLEAKQATNLEGKEIGYKVMPKKIGKIGLSLDTPLFEIYYSNQIFNEKYPDLYSYFPSIRRCDIIPERAQEEFLKLLKLYPQSNDENEMCLKGLLSSNIKKDEYEGFIARRGVFLPGDRDRRRGERKDVTERRSIIIEKDGVRMDCEIKNISLHYTFPKSPVREWVGYELVTKNSFRESYTIFDLFKVSRENTINFVELRWQKDNEMGCYCPREIRKRMGSLGKG